METTREAIIRAATAMVQAQGYNGLSFRELAKVVGIRSASIHHHFPTKADLGVAIVSAYRKAAQLGLQRILDEDPDPANRLHRYAEGFRAALTNENRMCLCGILGAEFAELPDPVRTEVHLFVDQNVSWLANVLESTGRVLADEIRPRATSIYAAISGAQLAARTTDDIATFDTVLLGYRSSGLLPG